jgi:hypothetical protein
MFNCFFFLPPPVRADEADEVPLVGRPVEFPFSQASAGFARQGGELLAPFRVEATATPRRVEVEQPVTLTVTIRAVAPVRLPPRRIDLREVPAFSRHFHVEDVTDGKKERLGPTAWRWTYRLRPRQVGHTEVPGVPFVFYNPDLRPADRAFQVVFTDPVRLTVTPPEPPVVPGELPPTMLEVDTGPPLLARVSRWSGPGPMLVVAVLALPPLLCAGWYLAWRRLYPDALLLSRQRRSWAAQRALAALDAAQRRTGRAQAESVSSAVVLYLRERFDLVPLEPTPQESARWLERFGYPETLTERLQLLLEGCAAARFGPAPAPDSDLAGPAQGLIVELEESSCPPLS